MALEQVHGWGCSVAALDAAAVRDQDGGCSCYLAGGPQPHHTCSKATSHTQPRSPVCSPPAAAVRNTAAQSDQPMQADAVAVAQLPLQWHAYRTKCFAGRRKSRLSEGSSSSSPLPPERYGPASVGPEQAACFLSRVRV